MSAKAIALRMMPTSFPPAISGAPLLSMAMALPVVSQEMVRASRVRTSSRDSRPRPASPAPTIYRSAVI
jgi:hypothetical protein